MDFSNRNDPRDAAREQQERDRNAAKTQQQRDSDARNEQSRSEHQRATQRQISEQAAAKNLAADRQRDKQKQVTDQQAQKQRLAQQQRSRAGGLKRPNRPDNSTSQIAGHKARVAQIQAREQTKAVAQKEARNPDTVRGPGMPVGSFDTPNTVKQHELTMKPGAEMQQAGIDAQTAERQRAGIKAVTPDKTVSVSEAKQLMSVASRLGISSKELFEKGAETRAAPSKQEIQAAIKTAEKVNVKAEVMTRLRAAEREAAPEPERVRTKDIEPDHGR